MPRKPRVKSASQIYHVIIRGVNQQIIFEESKDYEKFLNILASAKTKYFYRLDAYCLMNNHVHLLLKTEDLPALMRYIECKFVYWYNNKYDRSGHLFQGRYRSENVETDSYYAKVLRYIHFNPVKAHVVKKPGDYTWSSHNDYVRDQSDFVNTSHAIKVFGNLKSQKAYLRTESDDKCMDISPRKKSINDDEILAIIRKKFGLNGPSDFQKLEKKERNKCIKYLKEHGASLRKIARVSGYSKGTISRVK